MIWSQNQADMTWKLKFFGLDRKKKKSFPAFDLNVLLSQSGKKVWLWLQNKISMLTDHIVIKGKVKVTAENDIRSKQKYMFDLKTKNLQLNINRSDIFSIPYMLCWRTDNIARCWRRACNAV